MADEKCPYIYRKYFDDYFCNKVRHAIPYAIYIRYCTEYSYDECPNYKACFVATTVCNELGMQDAETTLDILHCLRHEIMEGNTKYQEALKTYDVVGPAIISEMAKPYMISSGDEQVDTRPQIIKNLYNMCMVPVSELVKQNRIEEAVELYKDTMNLLVQGYGITDQYVVSNNEEQRGKGQLLVIK